MFFVQTRVYDIIYHYKLRIKRNKAMDVVKRWLKERSNEEIKNLYMLSPDRETRKGFMYVVNMFFDPAKIEEVNMEIVSEIEKQRIKSSECE